MSKKKIADSIIIKVGGGIREVPRKPHVTSGSIDSSSQKPGFESTDDVHPFGIDHDANGQIGSTKIIN